MLRLKVDSDCPRLEEVSFFLMVDPDPTLRISSSGRSSLQSRSPCRTTATNRCASSKVGVIMRIGSACTAPIVTATIAEIRQITGRAKCLCRRDLEKENRDDAADAEAATLIENPVGQESDRISRDPAAKEQN